MVKSALRKAELQLNVLELFNRQVRAGLPIPEALDCVFEVNYVRAQWI